MRAQRSCVCSVSPPAQPCAHAGRGPNPNTDLARRPRTRRGVAANAKRPALEGRGVRGRAIDRALWARGSGVGVRIEGPGRALDLCLVAPTAHPRASPNLNENQPSVERKPYPEDRRTVFVQPRTIFPAGKTVSPGAGTVFPAAQTVPPPARTVLPAPQTIFRPARTALPATQTVFRAARAVFPASGAVLPPASDSAPAPPTPSPATPAGDRA